MATFEFDMPDGTKKRAIGNTPEEAWQSVNASLAPPSEPRKPGEKEPLKLGEPIDVLRGVSQGLLDPVEGLVQLAEKTTGWDLAPKGLRDWARDYRKKAQSTVLGQGGEIGGNLLWSAVPGVGAARTAALAGRVAPWLGRATVGAVGGMAAPVSGGGSEEDYWRAKQNQASLGAIGGTALPAIAGAAARAGQIPAHISYYHPLASSLANVAAQGAGAAGRGLQTIAPEAAGAAAGEIWGQ